MATLNSSNIVNNNVIQTNDLLQLYNALNYTTTATPFLAEISGSLFGTASYCTTASFALNGGGGGGTTFERRHDFQSPYDYCGVAPDGTAESAPNWTITRLTVFLNGSVVTGTAVGAWTNRTELIYDTPIPT